MWYLVIYLIGCFTVLCMLLQEAFKDDTEEIDILLTDVLAILVSWVTIIVFIGMYIFLTDIPNPKIGSFKNPYYKCDDVEEMYEGH